MISKEDIIGNVLTLIIISVVVGGCIVMLDEAEEDRQHRVNTIETRFELLEQFHSFEGRYDKMIRDKISGQCYLYMSTGHGLEMAPVDCNHRSTPEMLYK